jgi:copper homeostasis protein (lipoprotein)
MRTLVTTLILVVTLTIGCQSPVKNTDKNTDSLSGDNGGIVVDHEHTAQNSLDYYGIYEGVLPCADCEGIKIKVTLKEDQSFEQEYRYITTKNTNVYKEEGSFHWDAAGSTINLKGGEFATRYFVGENTLIMLNSEGKKIEGPLAAHYILQKQTSSTNVVEDIDEEISLIGPKWKLVEIFGKPVDNENDPLYFIQLNTNGRLAAFGGCNTLGGTYEIKQGNRIVFSKLLSTMKACADMGVEQELSKALEMSDNFSIRRNTMTLNKARMAPLATFETVK